MNRDAAAQLLRAFGVTQTAGAILNNIRLRGPLVRAVNYHGTPEAYRETLRRHVQFYRDSFTLLDEGMLAAFLQGTLRLDRPGLLLTFDDGLKSNYTVAADILDNFGIKGFFFLPVQFINLAVEGEAQARAFYVDAIGKVGARGEMQAEDYLPMSWPEAGELVRRGHAVGCHGFAHKALSHGLGEDELNQEIVESKRIMEQQLGVPISSFCWPFGTASSYSKAAHELIQKHYRFAFTTFASPLFAGGDALTIDRSNVEAYMSLARVTCAVQGITELYFRGRRRRFNALIK